MTVTRTYDFDTIHSRLNTSSPKWSYRFNEKGQKVALNDGDISLRVAEMEFAIAPEIQEALKKRIEHGFLGYIFDYEPLREVIVERVKNRYNWDIQADWIVFNPGMVMFLGVLTDALTQRGAGVMMSTPAYGPFLSLPPQFQRFAQRVPLQRVDDDANTFHYDMDFTTFEAAITAQTGMFYLCNPHNPIGKSFSKSELERIAEICAKHDVLIVSDDIHCDLMLNGREHTPIATLSPEIAQNTVTLISGTKSFNMAGNACSVAIIPDAEKREKVQQLSDGASYHVGSLAFEGLLAAYRDGDEWLREVNLYLTANRDFVRQYVLQNLPMLKTTIPDGTYMMWLDFSVLDLPDKYASVTEFFAEEAGVIFSPGSFFGDNLNKYARLNFACPRSMLEEALDRIAEAINSLSHV